MTEHICPKSPDKTLQNNQSKESQTTKWHCVFNMRPNFQLQLLASFISSL